MLFACVIWFCNTRADCEENCYKLAQHLSSRLHSESKDQREEDARAAAAAVAASNSSSSSSLSSHPPAPTPPLPSSMLLLSESLYDSLRGDRVFVCFMSNAFQQLTIWKQKIGDPQNDGGVVWDYHVIVIVRPDPAEIGGKCSCAKSIGLSSSARAAQPPCACAAWVYDMDSSLPFPCPMPLYARAAFRAHLPEPAGLGPTARRKRERLFRVCGAHQFLQQFASDRSHMIVPAQVLRAVREAAATESAAAGSGAGVEGQSASASTSAAAASAAAATTEPTRRDVQIESQTRQAEQSSWDASPVKDRLGSSKSASAATAQKQYLAPPPNYPPIRTAESSNNLDDYRFFAFPDSGKGVVMTQAEMLDFFHSAI